MQKVPANILTLWHKVPVIILKIYKKDTGHSFLIIKGIRIVYWPQEIKWWTEGYFEYHFIFEHNCEKYWIKSSFVFVCIAILSLIEIILFPWISFLLFTSLVELLCLLLRDWECLERLLSLILVCISSRHFSKTKN